MAKRLGSSLASYQKTVLQGKQNQPHRMGMDYYVPELIGEIGDLFHKRATGEEMTAEYADLAQITATMLDYLGVSKLGPEAIASSTHRWASKVDPWAALLTRAETIHLLHAEDRPDMLPAAVEKLWAALEARSEAITGVTFDVVLQKSIEASE